MDVDDIAIERIAVDDLRADTSGVLIEELASLAYRAFREPPWNDDLERPRLHFGLGVDLMRRNAVAFIAKAKDSGQIAGYALGYEVFRESEDRGTLRSERSQAPPRSMTYSRAAGAYSTYTAHGHEGHFSIPSPYPLRPGEAPAFLPSPSGGGKDEGISINTRRISFKTASRSRSTSSFQNRITRYHRASRYSVLRASCRACSACCPPSTSITSLGSRHAKSAT